MTGTTEHIDTLVIGGGQAGLSTGYHLSRAGIPFVIVDANERTGDPWRNRWDSLRLFTPNRFNSLPGLAIPGEDWGFPTKDEMADYLESYAQHFDLPIRHRTRVENLAMRDNRFVAETSTGTIEAHNVVIAMSSYQTPRIPDFADGLSAEVVQIHASEYANADQLGSGAALVVGVGNSGAEIAKELVADRQVFLSGEPTGSQPFRPEKLSGRLLMPIVGPLVMNGLLSKSTPMGRRFAKKMSGKAAPLMRVKPKDLMALGVHRVDRVVGVADGRPQLEGGEVLDVGSVVWATGYDHGLDWVDLPIFDDHGWVMHERGVVEAVPGLYFVAIKFQHSPLSDTLLAVGTEAELIVEKLAARSDRALETV